MLMPRSAAGLPLWRRRVLPVLMALLRVFVCYVVLSAQLDLLLRHPGVLAEVASPLWLRALGGALLLGALLFIVPRTVAYGAILTALGLIAYEWLWRRAGLPPFGVLPYALALLAVLALSQLAVRRIQQRVYGIKPPA
jgi:hypothetical protein